jgi:hypothetical protein
MRILTLLEACECCFAGADLPTVGSELRGFDAECADRSGTPFLSRALWRRTGTGHVDAEEALHGCNVVVGRFGAEGATRVVALALSEEHHHT